MLLTEENFDSLFAEKQEIQQIEISKIHPFKNHPYKVIFNDEMQELMNSIKEYGILEPLKLRKDEIGYEVISGHRRLNASMRLGLKTVPATVYEISRDKASIMLVDSNLHREHILPSEKAFAYKMKYEALKHQGKTIDSTSCQVGTKSRTDEIISENTNDSARQVQRYIHLTNLIPDFLNKMDEGKIAFTVGESLSYLNTEMQKAVFSQCELNDCTPSYAQSIELKKAFQNGTLTEENIAEIMCREKANQKETFKIPLERLKGKIPNNLSKEQTEDFVIKAVEHYHRYLLRQQENLR